MSESADLGFETAAIHAGQAPDTETGAVVPPIHLSTTFAQTAVGEHKGFEYARSGNPTRAALEACMCALESAEAGFAYSSGLAASDNVLRQFPAGTRFVIPHDAYGGTYRLAARVYGPAGYDVVPADLTDPDALDTVAGDIGLVWIETPTNPTLSIVDIGEVATRAHARGALVVVDNTFATPWLQQPIALGADVVVHSSTKYLGGHSDVVGGFVAVGASAESVKPGLVDGLRFLQNAAGAVPSPFDCYLLLRGLKTLALRVDRQCENAWAIAEMLMEHPAVASVMYPGLPIHPNHDVAQKQMRAPGGMVSFVMAAGEPAALQVVASTRLFTLAESLGAVESLIEHPARMTHASVADSPLAVDPGLVRLSVGVETLRDLVDDLRQALAPYA